MYISNRRTDTSLRIIQAFAKSFLENGYSKTSTKKIADEMKLSPGNITFYFPSKEDILAVVVDDLVDFEYMFMEDTMNGGADSMFSYALVISTVAALCQIEPAARDLLLASYTHQSSIDIIRERDTHKVKKIFGKYQPDWTDVQWRATENIAFGIEYATFVTRDKEVPFEVQVSNSLNTIMFLYGVPAEDRDELLKKISDIDCRALGKEAFAKFCDYITTTHERNIRHHSRYKN